ncbi:unnamed protein product, partial [Brenthis ino]
MKGKTVIVTGSNSGIGYHTAIKLASRGAQIILACRNKEKGKHAQMSIIAATGNYNILVKQLDLSSLASIKRFVDDILIEDYHLDVLVNNAGVFSVENSYTEDGLVEGMQINHYGPFLLTLLLLPKLIRSRSRIVYVSSLIYIFGKLDLNTINKPASNRLITYANSKFCNLVFHQELARRLKNSGVVVNSVHPGVIKTNLLIEANFIFRLFFNILHWFSGRSAEDGAETVVHVSVSKKCENVTGKYFIDCKDYYVLPKAKNEILAQKLWSMSAKCVKYNEDLNDILNY